uniref:Uncharacterized protein n=1 Tax=Panagrolaimus superbus TaxID=310955 RepID=A0A914YM27_9BILA
MENSKNEIVHPFDIECKFKKADLIDLKESENGFLNGKCFYAFNIPGLQYFIRICPNVDKVKHRGETWIYLYVNGSKERNITAKFTISVESANYSKSFNYVYQAYNGRGNSCCKTADFFETKNKYFVNGKVTIKIKGTLKTERSLIQKISSPVSMQWKIKEEILKAKNELQNEYLRSKRKIITSFSGVKYYLSIWPNKIENGEPPKTWLYLNIEMENEKKIEAVCDFSVDSVYFKRVIQYTFEKSGGWGGRLFSTVDLFNPLKGYFIDGYLTINLNGIFLTETNEKIELNAKKFNKDFTIVVSCVL